MNQAVYGLKAIYFQSKIGILVDCKANFCVLKAFLSLLAFEKLGDRSTRYLAFYKKLSKDDFTAGLARIQLRLDGSRTDYCLVMTFKNTMPNPDSGRHE
jgi:hypothetical protein